MKNNSYNNFFVNLANETKLDIILALEKAPLNVTQLSREIKGEQSNISHHLKDLVNCKILNVKQSGKNHIYSLNKKTILPILKLVEKHAKINCSGGCSKDCKGCYNE